MQPSWTHARGRGLGSVCWLQHLLTTNRERLYKQIVEAVMNSTQSISKEYGAPLPKISFRVVKTPADGKCGWRSILAAFDHESFERVPRTGVPTTPNPGFVLRGAWQTLIAGPGRNEARYPLNYRQNKAEETEASLLCQEVCPWDLVDSTI